LALAKDEAPTANTVVIGNRAGAHKKSELPRAEVEKALKMNLAAVIAEEQGVVLEALNTGKALPHFAPRSKAVVALRTLVQNVDRVETDDAGFLARLFGGKKTKGADSAKKEPLAAAG
jgi:Flp pilus assembly CpaE family ATPase